MIVGIDPGFGGSIANILPDGTVCVYDMPTVTVTRGKKKRRHLDLSAVVELIQDDVLHVTRHVFIEQVASRPTDGGVQAFRFGEGFGALRGIIAALGLSVTYVRPQEWKGAFGLLKTDKAASRLRAKELFPGAIAPLARKPLDAFSRVRDDGRAEAALIAEFGRRILMGKN